MKIKNGKKLKILYKKTKKNIKKSIKKNKPKIKKFKKKLKRISGNVDYYFQENIRQARTFKPI